VEGRLPCGKCVENNAKLLKPPSMLLNNNPASKFKQIFIYLIKSYRVKAYKAIKMQVEKSHGDTRKRKCI